jgi:hypothetical protein
MTDTQAPKPVTIPRPPSINDDLPTSNPSGKTVLIVLGCAAVLLVLFLEFHTAWGF